MIFNISRKISIFISSLEEVRGNIVKVLANNKEYMPSRFGDAPEETANKEGKIHFPEDSRGYSEETGNILKEILCETAGLYEIAVHQLAYNIDIFGIEKYGRQVLDVDYKPDHHGVYSEDISKILQELAEDDEIEAIADMYEGEFVTRYNRDCSGGLSVERRKLVKHVLSEVNQESNSIVDLVERSREHTARRNTGLSNQIDLEKYRQEINQDETEKMFSSSELDVDIDEDSVLGGL